MSQHVQPLIDHLFRHESGKLVALLTRLFGPTNLELAEDVVQDTLLKALDHWKFHGIPDNPSAWLFTAARNKALDVLRRERYKKEFAADLSVLLKSEYSAATTVSRIIQEGEIEDEQLRMMFVCCHPVVAEEGQVALILKTLCGFSVAEISRAFLTQEETVAKRLYRAREQFREKRVRFEIPPTHDLPPRLESVLTAIYLLFNEGYHSSSRDQVIREDLVEESLRLAFLLSRHPLTRTPDTFALLALMCFHAARLYGRLDSDNHLLTLRDQDRTRWNQELIGQGRMFLQQAAAGHSISPFHLEAAIAFEHCIAVNFDSTNWKQILGHYDILYKVKPNAIVGLNRAVVVAEVSGGRAGLNALNDIPDLATLSGYYLLPAIRGDFYSRTGDLAKAKKCFADALACARSSAEEFFLTNRIRQLELRQQGSHTEEDHKQHR